MVSVEADVKAAADQNVTAGAIWTPVTSDATHATVTETTPLVSKTSAAEEGGGVGPGRRGLSVRQAALLIAGEMAGSGVLAMPRALAKTGWLGLPLIIVMCAIAAYGGSLLGGCWAMIEERHPEMRGRRRNPYALIAQHALGRKGSAAVSACVQVTLLGAGVVYLLLATQLAEELLRSLFPSLGFCLWLLVIALLITPALWLGTPKDFSYVGIIAFGSTVLACLCFFTQILNDVKPYKVYRYGIHGFEDFFLAFGTILFSFGGASTFPTIQNDMAEKNKFSKSIIIAFSGILILYLPVTIAAYVVYGESVAPNFALSLTPTAMTMMGNLLMAIHLVFAIVIILNPVFQEWEEIFKVPHEFSWRRATLRSCLMLGMLLVAESLPRFSALLALVGGSTVALLTYILPAYCHARLVRQAPDYAPGLTPLYKDIVLWEIMAVGGLGGLAATYSAVSAIFSNRMVLPCYLQ